MSLLSPITPLLEKALAARADLFDARHDTAFRLFNGFYEGCSDLAIDIYARTLLLHNYADPPHTARGVMLAAQDYLLARLEWIRAAVVKTRNAAEDTQQRRGILTYGEKPDTRVRDPQGSVWYAIDLTMNRDASLYLDTRELRAWIMRHSAGKAVLNTFAYTGSLGVAAMAGGARRVAHLDAKRAFLNVAKTSYTLNGFLIHKTDFVAGDFFSKVSHFKKTGARFDCVFLDPPFFSTTRKGTIDLVQDSARVINKVRPLIEDGGCLVAINNALFVSGAAYMRTLESLCADGYLSVEELIPVPLDFTGYPSTQVGAPPVDPAPFNHSTKIAVLRVHRK
jgi:23S rRNA (cytosine1962-C5)-methyltransferase